ncbi:MAG: type II secretion system F family protein [Thermodesulfobacteriota bacterium]
MPIFFYRARDRRGALITGKLEGRNRDTIEVDIDRMGLIPINVSQKWGAPQFSLAKFGSVLTYITQQDLIVFSRQLATLFGAGIPLTRALSTLESQATNQKFAEIIKNIRGEVEGGSTLANAMSKQQKVFGELYIGMIEAGEAGGILESVLERLAFMLEKTHENRSKVRSATLYPKIVVGAIILAATFLLWFVIPKFSNLYGSFNVALPLPTRVLIAFSNIFQSYWYLALLSIIAVYFVVKFYKSTERGRYNWDRLTLIIPIFGPLILKSIMSRFARTLGSLYKSGMPILQSMDIVSRGVENTVITKSIKKIEEDVKAGMSLSEPMTNTRLFPPLVIQMVGVGEETGALDEMLEKVAQYYDQEVDSSIRNLTTTLEPILLAFIFGMVLFLALAIFMPMWDLVSLVK